MLQSPLLITPQLLVSSNCRHSIDQRIIIFSFTAGYAGYAAPYAAPYAAYGAYGHGAYSHGAIAAPIVAKAAYPAYGASYATYHH